MIIENKRSALSHDCFWVAYLGIATRVYIGNGKQVIDVYHLASYDLKDFVKTKADKNDLYFVYKN